MYEFFESGWCDQRDKHNGAFDHFYRESCVNFVSYEEHDATVAREAAKYDANATFAYPNGATNKEAFYVEQERGR